MTTWVVLFCFLFCSVAIRYEVCICGMGSVLYGEFGMVYFVVFLCGGGASCGLSKAEEWWMIFCGSVCGCDVIMVLIVEGLKVFFECD
ncbi:hypothetical protein PFJ87_06g01990 [Encephalitozoon hellem]|uniref:Uncharacterized protein n=1 Tax=Encephalitozoon hellem TaxID=27973 RepID=A0ABY8CJ72_ENCHE|nr:hypothetical protein PFJ87_06g01990 [Encephalitozoon hellem]